MKLHNLRIKRRTQRREVEGREEVKEERRRRGGKEQSARGLCTARRTVLCKNGDWALNCECVAQLARTLASIRVLSCTALDTLAEYGALVGWAVSGDEREVVERTADADADAQRVGDRSGSHGGWKRAGNRAKKKATMAVESAATERTLASSASQ